MNDWWVSSASKVANTPRTRRIEFFIASSVSASISNYACDLSRHLLAHTSIHTHICTYARSLLVSSASFHALVAPASASLVRPTALKSDSQTVNLETASFFFYCALKPTFSYENLHNPVFTKPAISRMSFHRPFTFVSRDYDICIRRDSCASSPRGLIRERIIKFNSRRQNTFAVYLRHVIYFTTVIYHETRTECGENNNFLSFSVLYLLFSTSQICLKNLNC